MSVKARCSVFWARTVQERQRSSGTILDIFRPDTGTISLFGRSFSDDIKDAIGYLPEEGSLDKEILVSECIRYFAELKHVDAIDTKMDAWLEKLALKDYRDKKIQELSKGMHRRLQFILAVIHEPALLILDEPFSGLDPLNTKTLKDILLESEWQRHDAYHEHAPDGRG